MRNVSARCVLLSLLAASCANQPGAARPMFLPAPKLLSCIAKAEEHARRVIEDHNRATRLGLEEHLSEGRLLTLKDYRIHVIAKQRDDAGRSPAVMVMYDLTELLPWLGHPNHFTVRVEVDSGQATVFGGR